jgi:hypothetical protein
MSSYIPPLPQYGGVLYVEKCNLRFEPFIYLVPCLPNSFLQRRERRREEARRHEQERVTISRTMPPPTFFPTASELTDTKIDPRGGHLKINKGRRQQRKSGQGGGMGIAPERHCPCLRMRTYWQDND